MALDLNSVSILTRPLPPEKIKTRSGGGNRVYQYITPDFVIESLNEAFDYTWDTKIVYSEKHDNCAVVGLELSVPGLDGVVVRKQQFGSCDITKGLGVGDAFKGAASDALKKCATLLGLGLELYQADEPTVGQDSHPRFSPPTNPSNNRSAVPRPPAPPAARPVVPPAPPAPPAAPRPVPAASPQIDRAGPPSPPAPRQRTSPPAPPKPQNNPFASSRQSSGGPNSTLMNSLVSIAARKQLSPPDLIALAGIVDGFGNPVRSFEELSYEQGIQVVQAAQR